MQGPARCRGRALARSRPTPNTPHAPRAPLRVSSTLLDARSPCTCPAASASAPRVTPLCVLSCTGFMPPGQRTAVPEVRVFHLPLIGNLLRERQERLQARPARAARVQQPALQRALQGACAGQ